MGGRRTRLALLILGVMIAVGGAGVLVGNILTGGVEAQVPGSFVFTAAGDWNDTADTSATVNLIPALGASFNIALGDLSYGGMGSEAAWCDFIKTRVGPTFPFELVSGNHEDDGADGVIENFAACLPDHLGNIAGTYAKEYYFDYQGLARFILISPDLVIDQQLWEYTAGSSHYNWVAATIDEARAAGIPWVVVGMHKNCLTVGRKSCEMGQDLLNLLVDKKVDLILQGHDHNYQRSRQLALSGACPAVTVGGYNSGCVVDDGVDNFYVKGQGTVIVITGTAGAGLYDINPADPEAGYFVRWMGNNIEPRKGLVKGAVSDSQLAVEFVGSTTTSSFGDSFTISGGPTPTAGGPSPTPSPTLAPTPIPSGVIALLTDDATIKQATPGTNFGAATSLEVDGSPVDNFLVRFDVSGINGQAVSSAKLRLYNVNSSDLGGDIYRAASESWSESVVTWDSAPAAGQLLATLGSVVSGGWYEVDVTGAVTDNGSVSFRVSSTSSNGADYRSKEGAVLKQAQLLVTLAGGPTPTPGLSPTPTPTVAATPVPSPTATPLPTPSPSPTGVTVVLLGDATVKGAKPNVNYGLSSTLETDNSPVENFLVMFDVSGVNGQLVTSAKLRLYNVNKSNKGGDFYRGLSDTWDEGTVTWGTAPASGSLVASLETVAFNTWVEVDVTTAVVGDGPVTFRIASTSTDGADYSSRQGAADKVPQLILTVQ